MNTKHWSSRMIIFQRALKYVFLLLTIAVAVPLCGQSLATSDPDGLVCVGDHVTYTFTQGSAVGFGWHIVPEHAGESSGTDANVQTVYWTSSGTIYLEYGMMVNGNVVSYQLSYSVTVAPVPVINVLGANGAHGCVNTANDFSLEVVNPAHLHSYTWSLVPSSAGTISQAGHAVWATGFTGAVTVRATASACDDLVTIQDDLGVTIHARPVVPPEGTLQYCDFEPISLVLPAWTKSYNWYDDADNFLMTGTTYTVPSRKVGSYTYKAEYVDEFGCTSTSRFPINVSVVSCDENLNYIEQIAYDVNEVEVAHSRTYFEPSGAALQAQVRNLTVNTVLTSAAVKDQYGRAVVSSLSAPINQSAFLYKHHFITDASEELYDFDDFGQPLGSSTPGTVGWYYSGQYSNEQQHPKSGFPYSQVDFYNDGTGATRKAGGAGDVLQLGTGHEVITGNFPVFSELTDYLSKRSNLQLELGALTEGFSQTVVRDQNKKYAVSISDASGKVLMSALQGTDTDTEVPVSVTSSGNPASANYRPMTYFYILHDQAVTLTGSTDFIAENIVTEEKKAAGVTFAGQDGKWPAGFYRLILNNSASEITLGYKHYFKDISYQFYDNAGRLISSVSPNGYKVWAAAADPVTQYASIDKTTYKYNFRGWLLEMAEPDAGLTKYLYRKDGAIRFSQNAQQADDEANHLVGKGKFSYTNYDEQERPVESGEYTGTDANYLFASLGSRLEYGNQVNFTEKKDWVVTHYDLPDANFASTTGLGSLYAQAFIRGGVSWTENANIKTWYSYDELGRVTWMARKPKMLQRVFVVKYTYDFLGNVLMVANLSYTTTGTLLSQFYHHYEYDADKRLSKAYTSLEESGSKKLRATYTYYLHGPLKRIELGDDLQGIDFVYNIQGWLTQINHPDPAQDPGGDTNDAFGMVLDYYESDLANLLTSSVGSTHDPARRHGLPADLWAALTDHPPLIRFAPELPSSESALPLKIYSAEDQRYKQMIMQTKNK